MQVLSTVPVMFSYWARPQDTHDLSQLLNDHIADTVARHPAHFAGLGTIPLQDPDLACRELERCVRDLNLRGVQIGTHVEPNPYFPKGGRKADWNLSEPALFPIFETAAALGAAVFVHPWDMMGAANMEKYWLPWLVGMPAETSRAICSILFSGVLDRLPNLKICFAHGGGSFPGTIGRIDHGHRVRPDLCAPDCPTNPRAYLARPLPLPEGGGRGKGGVGGVGLLPLPSQREGSGVGSLSLPSQREGPGVGSLPLPSQREGPGVGSLVSSERDAANQSTTLLPARFYVDSLVHDPDTLRTLIRLFTPARIALGSDYPFPLGEEVPGQMINSMPDLTAQTRAHLLSLTAADFLSL